MATEIKDVVEPLSEKLTPTPLKDKEKAVFRLLSIGRKEVGRDDPTVPEVYQLSPKESVIDPFDSRGSRRKIMGTFVKDYKIVNGVQLPVYEPVKFIRGYCVTTAENHELYTRLIRSLKCRNNKFRGMMGGARVKAVFELVEDHNQEVSEQLYLADLRYHAESIVRESDWMSMKSIATQLWTSPDERLHTKSFIPGKVDGDIRSVKMELIHLAQLYPKQVIAASGNPNANAQVTVYELMRFGLLIFEQGGYFVFNDKTKKLEEVFTPKPDEDSVKSLVGFLVSEEGKKKYVLLIDILKKTLAPRT